MNACIVAGCGKPQRSRGLCTGHYSAQRRSGAMTRLTRRHETIEELAELGCSMWDISRRLSIKPESVERTLWRAGRHDVRDRLVRA